MIEIIGCVVITVSLLVIFSTLAWFLFEIGRDG